MTLNRKVGLVLSGGGGKGAYQIGCWEALRDAGIKDFAVISGTSVGALNGALVGIGNLEDAKALWRNLSEPKVVLTTFLRKLVVGAAFVVTTVTWTLLEYLAVAAGLTLIMLVAPWLVFFISLSRRAVNGEPRVAPVPTIAEWMAAHPWLVLGLVCFEAYFAWMALVMIREDSIRLLRANAKTIAVAVGKRLWAGSNRPLKKLLREHVTLDALRRSGTRVFATIATQRTLLDPYNGNWLVLPGMPTHEGSRRPDTYRLRSEPGLRSAIWAETIEVSGLKSDEELVNALSVSAQLPLVFRPGQWVGRPSLDGGLAENTPAWPAIQQCDVVIVIYLNYASTPSIESIKAEVAEMYYEERVSGMSAAEAQLIYSEFARVGRWEKPAPPVRFDEKRFVLVVPSQPLGSIVDFSGGLRVDRLMALGKRDMEQALQALDWNIGTFAQTSALS